MHAKVAEMRNALPDGQKLTKDELKTARKNACAEFKACDDIDKLGWKQEAVAAASTSRAAPLPDAPDTNYAQFRADMTWGIGNQHTPLTESWALQQIKDVDDLEPSFWEEVDDEDNGGADDM